MERKKRLTCILLMYSGKSHILLLFLSVIFTTLGFSQIPNGSPYSQYYDSDTYQSHEQNFDMVQDELGRYYFANVKGVLMFDGVNWENLEIKGKTSCLSLAKSEKGLFVGGGNEFGFLIEDPKKGMVYNSLRARIDSIENMGSFWHTFEFQDAIYFTSFKYVVKYKNNQLSLIDPGPKYHLTHVTPNRVFGFKNGEVDVLLEDQWFKLDTAIGNVYGVHEVNPNLYYFMTTNNGFVQMELGDDLSSHITIVEKPELEEINEARVYDYTDLGNGLFAIGTLRNGIYVLDNALNVINHFYEGTHLKDKMCLGIRTDNLGNLWAMTSDGLIRIEYNLPFGIIDIQKGIKDLCFYQDKLFIATDLGLYYIDADQFILDESELKQVDIGNGRCWDIEVVDGLLYAGSTDGLFSIDENLAVKPLNSTKEPTFVVRKSRGDNQLLIGRKEGFSFYDLNLQEETVIPQVDHQVRFIAYDDAKNGYWLASRNEGITFLNKDNNNVNHIDTLNGLKSMYEAYVFNFEDKVILSSDSTIGEITSVFPFEVKPLPEKLLAVLDLKDNEKIYRIFKESDGVYIFCLYKEEIYTRYVRVLKEGENYISTTKAFDRFSNETTYSYATKNGLAYFGFIQGLGVFDLSAQEKELTPFHSIISSVVLGGDSVYKSTNQTGINNWIPKVEYTKGTFIFNYATPYSTFPKNIEYSYQLEGYDDRWSPWTKETKKEYTNLFENDYMFKVKAKNTYGQVSEVASYKFVVTPPFYRETYMYVLYFLGVIGLGVFFSKLYIRKLRREKIELEALVSDRTREVVAQKEKVERQNQDILASIHYAKHLQSAILPTIHNDYFKDHFILFLPRDVVSGDFYWKFETPSHCYFAIIDCTGHGVPGAFVSITAFNALNRIIRDKEIYSPAAILTDLNKEVKEVFQNQGEEKAQDGMDLSLIRIDKNSNEIVYSGAQNPLWLIRNGELTIYKANKVSIGGLTEENYQFAETKIEVQEGDLMYLFTDGYADQFGGEKNKKFKSKQLKELLLNIAQLPCEEQLELVHKSFESWKGDCEQVDDVLLACVKF